MAHISPRPPRPISPGTSARRPPCRKSVAELVRTSSVPLPSQHRYTMGHGEQDAHLHGEKEHKLYLIKSPVVGDEAASDSAGSERHKIRDIENLGYRDSGSHECPEFEKHEEATNSELFYDLFFAANLTVFSEVHDVTNKDQLTSYIGYFCMLWFTWALVGLFDVRFVTDSIFERCARAVHLGVMVGFAVVAANFDPMQQVRLTFRAMSIILMASRLTMAVQYGTILWHVRRYQKTFPPLGMMIGLNLATAMVYLGLNFAFTESNTNIYVAWYVIGAAELVSAAVLSLFWKVLSFEGTHLISRMSLLTFIIIGEGLIVVCSNITLIVKNADSWTSPTIGTVTAAVTTLYIVYMIYFDWMRHLHLPRYRQLIWAVLHFPFHLSLTLFVEGSAQFVLWYKIAEVVGWFSTTFDDAMQKLADSTENISVEQVLDTVNSTLDHVFELYPMRYQDTQVAIDDAYHQLANVTEVIANATTEVNEDDPLYKDLENALEYLVKTVFNSLLANFDIEGAFKEASEQGFDGTEQELQDEVYEQNASRLNTVFLYAFISAGIVLLLMNLLYVVSRTKRFTPFNYFRTTLNTLFAVGLCLVSLVNNNDDRAEAYESSPWMLPTICLVFFIVLIVNHLPHPPPIFFRRREQHPVTQVSPLVEGRERPNRDSVLASHENESLMFRRHEE
ncbi:hypothetical protein GQ53DRAFT_520559 [Thozetella sp. PMI_491]|nr:hypothetical protein GQ53DRAFT_520559 [Thozetella sp. PMI_491]